MRRPPLPALTAPVRPDGPDRGRMGLFWHAGDDPTAALTADTEGIRGGLRRLSDPLAIVDGPDGLGLAIGGALTPEPGPRRRPVRAFLPPMPPEALGDPGFARTHGLRFNYVAGAMANGITSTDLVVAMGRAGMLGFFGAAGLTLAEVDAAITRLQEALPDAAWGSNLIHSPYEPQLERAVSDLYQRRGVRRVSASAYLRITPALVAYRLHGIHEDRGRIVTPNAVFAKVSRTEVAARFLAPAPEAMVDELRREGRLSEAQAQLARAVPLASAVTVEADSGGHTDNRPALCAFPEIRALRDRCQREYATPIAIGAAGGLGTPSAVAAAFSMGADYVLTGSINQACREAGTSDAVRALLAEAETADVTMAPAADMFEMGVELQVLRRGSMFAARARQLGELYRRYPSFEAIPVDERRAVETQIFRAPFAEIWTQTQRFWGERDPSRLAAAEAEPKRKMALCFRWYLGMSSRWANAGAEERRADYQVWCGPAMGAFNAWARGSWLEDWRQRRVVPIALQLMHGAALRLRAAMLAAQGIALAPEALDDGPRTVAELEALTA